MAAQDFNLNAGALAKGVEAGLEVFVTRQQPDPDGVVLDAELEHDGDETQVLVRLGVVCAGLVLGEVGGCQALPCVAFEVLDLVLDVCPHARGDDDLVDLGVGEGRLGVAGLLYDVACVLGVLAGTLVLVDDGLVVVAADGVLDGGADLEQAAVALDRVQDGLERLLLVAAAQGRAPDLLGLDGDLGEGHLDAVHAVLALLDEGVLLLGAGRGLQRHARVAAGEARTAGRARVGGARGRRVGALVAHFIVDAVDGGLCADEALEVGLDEDLERGRLLLDGAREEVEALQERVGRGIAVDLREEERGREGGGAEEEAVAWGGRGVSGGARGAGGGSGRAYAA